MNFLNEITFRYPKAISFAPGRPYDGFFDTEQIFTHIRRYLDHLAEHGSSPEQIRAAMFQYGPTAGRIRELIASSLRKDENIDVPAESIVVAVNAEAKPCAACAQLRPEDVFWSPPACGDHRRGQPAGHSGGRRGNAGRIPLRRSRPGD
jgi:hypothetical protein